MSSSHDSLADVAAVVRRTLAARTRDRDLIEDLTQEALARVADTEHQLSPDGQRAYAVVVARNLLTSHFRGQSVRGRHLHRLLDRDGSDDPAQVTVDREETEALASALGQLDPAERELLMRHEVTGTDLATLAGEVNASRGAIAMRLARARANLRLEFLLAFRRVQLPTDRCRPVLLALAVGDQRRQVQLDAYGHIQDCPVCADLIEPMTRQDRRIAGWLLIPLAEALRRTRRALAGHPALAASAALVAVAATGVVFAVRAPETADRPSGVVAAPVAATDRPTTEAVRPTASDPPAPTTTASRSAPVAATAAPTEAPPPPPTAAPAAAPQDTTPPCPPPAPLDEIDVTSALGCPFGVTVVTITEVSGGDGFAAVTAGGLPVFIQLAGSLPPLIVPAPGLEVTIAGQISSEGGQPVAVEVAAGDVGLAG